MRLTEQQRQIIRQVVTSLVGAEAQVMLFGSRLDDEKKGGDIDLLVTFQKDVFHPAQLSAKISSQLTRQLQGRSVDVLLVAPNLKRLPIHVIAQNNGVVL